MTIGGNPIGTKNGWNLQNVIITESERAIGRVIITQKMS